MGICDKSNYIVNTGKETSTSPTCNSATSRSSALAMGKGTHLVQTMYTGVQSNTRPCTMLAGGVAQW